MTDQTPTYIVKEAIDLDMLLETPPLIADRGFSNATAQLIEIEIKKEKFQFLVKSSMWCTVCLAMASVLFSFSNSLVTSLTEAAFSFTSLTEIEALLRSVDSSLLIFALLPAACMGVIKLTD